MEEKTEEPEPEEITENISDGMYFEEENLTEYFPDVHSGVVCSYPKIREDVLFIDEWRADGAGHDDEQPKQELRPKQIYRQEQVL